MRRLPIDAFDLALGVHGGTVALVTVAAATGQGLLARPSLGAAVAVLLAVSGVAATRTNLVAWVVERHLHSVLGFVPTVPLLVVMTAASFGVVRFTTAFGWLGYLLPPAVTGLLVAVVAMRRYVAFVREHEHVLAEWTAGVDARYKWGVRAVLFVGAVAFFVGGLVIAFEFETETTFLTSFAGVFLAWAFVAGRERR